MDELAALGFGDVGAAPDAVQVELGGRSLTARRYAQSAQARGAQAAQMAEASMMAGDLGAASMLAQAAQGAARYGSAHGALQGSALMQGGPGGMYGAGVVYGAAGAFGSAAPGEMPDSRTVALGTAATEMPNAAGPYRRSRDGQWVTRGGVVLEHGAVLPAPSSGSAFDTYAEPRDAAGAAPWRPMGGSEGGQGLPGGSFFNYGMGEEHWRFYASQQRRIRTELEETVEARRKLWLRQAP